MHPLGWTWVVVPSFTRPSPGIDIRGRSPVTQLCGVEARQGARSKSRPHHPLAPGRRRQKGAPPPLSSQALADLRSIVSAWTLSAPSSSSSSKDWWCESSRLNHHPVHALDMNERLGGSPAFGSG